MPLSDSQLAGMRGRGANFLTQSWVIQQSTRTPDGMGGWTDSWATAGTVSGYLEARRPGFFAADVLASGNQMVVFTEYTLYLAHDATIAPGNRVVRGSLTYKVEGVIQADTARGFVHAKLTLES